MLQMKCAPMGGRAAEKNFNNFAIRKIIAKAMVTVYGLNVKRNVL
jgi:hypothetical protein